MRNPLRSEAEAFRFLVVVIVARGRDRRRRVDQHVGRRRRRGRRGRRHRRLAAGARRRRPSRRRSSYPRRPRATHRVLLVAPPGTSGSSRDRRRARPTSLVVVPALVSTVQSLTGAVDDRRAEAEQTARRSPARSREQACRRGGVVGADDTVLASRTRCASSAPTRSCSRAPTTAWSIRLASASRSPFQPSRAARGSARAATVKPRYSDSAVAVGAPALALVEPPRAGIVVEHPEDRVGSAAVSHRLDGRPASGPVPRAVPHASGRT